MVSNSGCIQIIYPIMENMWIKDLTLVRLLIINPKLENMSGIGSNVGRALEHLSNNINICGSQVQHPRYPTNHSFKDETYANYRSNGKKFISSINHGDNSNHQLNGEIDVGHQPNC